MNYIFEFFGMPSAGKTTQSNLIVERLSSMYPIYIFGDRKIPMYDGETFYQFNRRFLATLEQFMTEHNTGSDKLLLMDRGYHDCRIWPEVHLRMGNMTDQEVRSFNELLQQSRAIPIEQAILFMIDPAVTMERRVKIPHPAAKTVSKPAYLDTLHAVYQEYAETNSKKLTVIDGTQSIEAIYRQLMNRLAL